MITCYSLRNKRKGSKNMEEFIMTVRQNRKKEIEQYVEKGYEFIDEKKYIF